MDSVCMGLNLRFAYAKACSIINKFSCHSQCEGPLLEHGALVPQVGPHTSRVSHHRLDAQRAQATLQLITKQHIGVLCVGIVTTSPVSEQCLNELGCMKGCMNELGCTEGCMSLRAVGATNVDED